MFTKKRKDYISDIVRYGTNLEVIIPTTVLNEKTFEPDTFKILRDSLTILQEDPALIVTLNELEDGLTSVSISINPENNIEAETTNTD